MKRFRWRLRPLVVLAAAGVTAIGLLISHNSSVRFLHTRLSPLLPQDQVEAVVRDFGTAFIAFSAIAIGLSVVLSIVLGTAAIETLGRLRSDAAARARGMAQPPYRPPVAEIQSLSASIERLADDLGGRAEVLRRERDELALLVNSVSEGILLIEPGGRILHANPAARRLLGLPDASRGQLLPSLVRNAELRGIAGRLAEVTDTLTMEITVNERRMLVIGRPIAHTEPHADADLPGAVIAFVDLTELRRLEGVRRDFVANVSHELKTPLTSIRGYAETLIADELDPGTRRQFLEVIHKNADRLHNIVEDLLDLSKLESGGWQPRLRVVSAADVARDAWEGCADRAHDRQITYQPPDADAFVNADESALRQIFANLLDNAIRYTGNGGSIRVRVRAEPAHPAGPNGAPPSSDGDRVVIEVQDSGIGIPSDALPRIFERFYRVDPARSRADGGTGLGLSIVKHLAESMNGDVSASSDLGKGTTVRVRLPAAGASAT
jgi:two-component system, OmpR family, phosphate regulon sensor histidine kinase PhoR